MTRRVFIVDDSPFALQLVHSALGEIGLDVVTGRGLADLSRLDGKPVDLVLMDVEMPEVFGDDLAQWLIGQGQPAKIYLMSSLPAEELAERARDCGAAGFIEKRIGVDGVVARVLEVLGESATGLSVAPTLLADEFVSIAHGRLTRAEAAAGRGDAITAGSELHTLCGEAALLGAADLAAAALEARGVPAAALPGALGKVRAALDAVSKRARVELPKPAAGPTARILLLDDSELYRSVLMSLLEDAGFEVVEARRMSEARHRMHEGPYDLAVLDVQLEDGRGPDLIPELRQHIPGARVVLLSGDAVAPSGADVVLSKSLEPEALLQRLSDLART